MAKKRFGMDQQTNTAISQVMQMAEQYESIFNNTVIPISKITIDPNNPRKHSITAQDLINGPSNSDPNYNRKAEEYEGLCELSTSIKNGGLLHPIIVYKHGEGYQLVAGERRLFASIIAGINHIDARAFHSKPDSFDLKIIQWVENESRKDLNLHNRLINISSILKALQEKRQEDKITAQMLGDTLSISRPLAQNYLSILQNEILMDAIKEEKVTTLQLARTLAKYRTKEEFLNALEQSHTKTNEKNSINEKVQSRDKTKKVGRKRSSVSLGKTRNPCVVKLLVEGVLSKQPLQNHIKYFETVDWACLDQSTKAMQKLVKILEKELGDMK